MFVDASALAAMLLNEPDSAVFASALERSARNCVTSFVVMEVGLALLRETPRSAEEAYSEIESVLGYFRVETIELTSPMILMALQAYQHYGKGRGHPARLNMGDCFSYAAARTLKVPLLYKGDDFARTDIVSALAG